MSRERVPVRTEAPDAERLRFLCLTILGTFESAGNAPSYSAALARDLAQAMGAGIDRIVDGLRHEAEALNAAIGNLQNLPARYMATPRSASELLVELEAARAQAERLSHALGSLRGDTSEILPHLEDHATSQPATRADLPTLAFAAAPTETNTIEVNPAIPRGTRRAARVFREAQEDHKRHNYDRAAVLYDEVLRIDPRFGPAYSRRGQVRLACGNVDGAIADFDSAIELDAAAVEAWWWRGDSHAVAGRLDRAIADYTQALELRPDLERARFNRSVALRRKEEAATPLAPTSPPGSVPLTEKSPPAKKGVGKIAVQCPHCREAGEVPLDRLGKIFACKACQRRFGVGVDGIAVELVESKGKWVEAAKVREQSQRTRKRRIAVVGVVLAAVLVPAIGFAGWRTAHPVAEAAEIELPADLDVRVDLFARAWLSNDVRLMRRLTSPAQEKVLYAWYSRHRPPVAHRGPADGVPPEGAQVATVQQPGPAGRTIVRMRISNPRVSPTPVEITLTWEDRGGSWFFVPPPK